MSRWRQAPPWVVFALGAASGIAVLVTGQSIVGIIEIPDGLGGLLGGVAALSGAAAAWAGFSRWEDRQRRERQAEVAGGALVVASELASIMREIARGEDGRMSGPEAEYYDACEERLWNQELRARFDRTHQQIEAYLPQQMGELWERLRALRDEQANAIECATATCNSHGMISEHAVPLLKQVEGEVMLARLQDVMTALKAGFRRFALLE